MCEFKMCYVVFEIFDGKDIFVFNEKFISLFFINWMYKDLK